MSKNQQKTTLTKDYIFRCLTKTAGEKYKEFLPEVFEEINKTGKENFTEKEYDDFLQVLLEHFDLVDLFN